MGLENEDNGIAAHLLRVEASDIEELKQCAELEKWIYRLQWYESTFTIRSQHDGALCMKAIFVAIAEHLFYTQR